VTDEFGVVQGLVTLVDIFEAIAGDLPEAGRQTPPETSQRADGEWLIDATLPLGQLKTLLGVTAPLPHEVQAEFHTAGGFVVTQLGRIPAVGDHFDWKGWRFKVVEMDRNRVDKLSVRPPAAPPPPAA